MAANINRAEELMVDAAKLFLGKRWSTLAAHVLPELAKIARQIELIHDDIDSYTPSAAKHLLSMQITACTAAIVGLSAIAEHEAQALINTAIDAARDFVNKVVGFRLL